MKHTPLKISRNPLPSDEKLFKLHKQGKGNWKFLCTIIPTNREATIALHQDILVGKCGLFETTIYGDSSTFFSQDAVTKLSMTQEQYNVLTTIIIPFIYNHPICIPLQEEYIHSYAMADYFQISELLVHLEHARNKFVHFGLFYKLLHFYEQNYNSIITIGFHDVFSLNRENGGALEQCVANLDLCLHNFENLLDIPYNIACKVVASDCSNRLRLCMFSFIYAKSVMNGKHWEIQQVEEEYWSGVHYDALGDTDAAYFKSFLFGLSLTNFCVFLKKASMSKENKPLFMLY